MNNVNKYKAATVTTTTMQHQFTWFFVFAGYISLILKVNVCAQAE